MQKILVTEPLHEAGIRVLETDILHCLRCALDYLPINWRRLLVATTP